MLVFLSGSPQAHCSSPHNDNNDGNNQPAVQITSHTTLYDLIQLFMGQVIMLALKILGRCPVVIMEVTGNFE
jgi:hypothetical protein